MAEKSLKVRSPNQVQKEIGLADELAGRTASRAEFGGATFDRVPFLIEAVVETRLRRPLPLFADIVETARERLRGLSERAELIVKFGGLIQATLFGVEPFDEMLTSFPDGRALGRLRAPVVGRVLAFPQPRFAAGGLEEPRLDHRAEREVDALVIVIASLAAPVSKPLAANQSSANRVSLS